MQRPYLDLRTVNAPFLAGFEQDLAACIAENQYVLGKGVQAFEEAYAAYIGTEHCIGVGNATDALFLILTALGIGLGDDVLVQAHTCDATWVAIAATGARPVPVDVRYETLNLNPELLPAALTPQTRAVIVVHMNGAPAELAAIAAFCQAHNLPLIEDNAQATGATYRGRRTGSFGLAAAHSFYPTKPLGALGDGGAVTTHHPELADAIRALANYGKPVGNLRERLLGYNSRLDDLQARFLLRKLPYVDEGIQDRAVRAEQYRKHLAGLPVQMQELPEGATSAHHLFTILSEDRDLLRQELERMGIGTAIHYGHAPHQLAPFGYPDEVAPVAARIARETLSLPL